MPNATSPYSDIPPQRSAILREKGLEDHLIGRFQGLKYEYRPDIRDRAALERNFREKFEALNRVRLTDSEFTRLLDEIISGDVLAAAKTQVIVTTIQKLGLALDENSKRSTQRKKNDRCFTRLPRLVISGASREIRHYNSMSFAGGWYQTQNKWRSL